MANDIMEMRKLRAIELLAQGNLPLTQVAGQAGVSDTTLRTWRKLPEFRTAVVNRAYDLMKEMIPKVLGSVAQKAAEGSVQHAKLFLEHLEKVEDLRTQQVEGQITFTWSAPMEVADSDDTQCECEGSCHKSR